jgi:tetratricopeptide (TPR) repeat protein
VSAEARATFGLVGALSALPRRLAARAAEAHGCRLQRGTTRATTHVAFGRSLLARPDPEIARSVDGMLAGSLPCLSENGLMRRIGVVPEAPGGDLGRLRLAEQSGLGLRDLDRLALFDAFEHDCEPFSFRDLILARKYAGLIAGGAAWTDIARSIHRSGPAVSLTAKSLQIGACGRTVYARDRDGLSELDGQFVLGLGAAGEDDPETLFAAAEAAEHEGRHDNAERLYARCLGLDPGDAVAAYNRANCLRDAGRAAEARAEYARALKLEPDFVEAWFNLGCLATAEGNAATARRHLERAVACDPDYADAVFNLAGLAFEAEDLDVAGHWWRRYLELDPDSEWGGRAARGLQFLALRAAAGNAG